MSSTTYSKLLLEEDEEIKVDLYSPGLDTPDSPNGSSLNCCGVDISTALVGFITFTGDSSRGILFPVLWNLTQYLGGSIVDLGYIVAMFSVGRLIVTTPLGYLSDKYGHRLPLTLCSITLFLGSILWANSYLTKSLPSLYMAQLIMGFGSGTLGITRSYVVEKVEPSKRTYILGLLTALQYAGFTMSPVFGSLFSQIGNSSGNNYLVYALPGYLIGVMSLTTFIGLLTVFENIKSNSKPQVVKKSTSPSIGMASTAIIIKTEASVTQNSSSRSIDESRILFLIIAFILLNVSTKGSIAVYETLGAQILENDYGFTIFAVGVLISVCGTIGTFQLVMFKSFWTKYFNDIQLMLGGIFTMILAQMLIVCYDGSTPSRERYIAGVVVMYGFGYPIGHTAVLGAFSKIQKSGPQAALMGWFATFGSVARVILPIGSGYLDSAINNGPFNMPLIYQYIFSINTPSQSKAMKSWELLQFTVMAAISVFSIYSLLWLTPVDDNRNAFIRR
eukprot:gene19843-25792_t